ncbi:MAG: AAA family ATPase [Acidobacteriota bacterium]|nr:AAA family ATPase [Acidobacteriota bacterium]
MIERRTLNSDATLSLIAIHIDDAGERTLRSAASAAGNVNLMGTFQQYFGEKDATLVRAIREYRPDLCVIDLDANRELALQTVEYMRRAMRRDMAIFAVSESIASDAIIAAMRSGCTEYLTKPLDKARLTEALTQLQKKRMEALLPPVQGKILALMGVKGGVGATTLACHLGVALARGQHRTLLADSHKDLGDVTLQLGLEHHNYGFHELVHNLERLDAELLQGFVMKHESGLEVLLSPESFIAPPRVSSDATLMTLRSMTRMFNNVIVDCGQGLDEMNMAILEALDELYLVTTPELPSVRNLVRYVDYVGRLIPLAKIKIIVNRTSKHASISNEHIEKTTKLKVSHTIPFAGPELADAIGAGVPVSHKSKSEFAQAINRWTASVAGHESVSEVKSSTGRGRFGLLRI